MNTDMIKDEHILEEEGGKDDIDPEGRKDELDDDGADEKSYLLEDQTDSKKGMFDIEQDTYAKKDALGTLDPHSGY